MAEECAYKDGDIVWVKLSNMWWPGEVIRDEQRQPDEVNHLKRKPYCVVKFFQEDAYAYPTNVKQIFPFQCAKKDEFTKKGLSLYNAKNDFMEKFPDDVKHAESLTKPLASAMTATTIINNSPGSIVKAVWGQGLLRKSSDYYESNQAGISSSSSKDRVGVAHHQPIMRKNSITTILNITPQRASLEAPLTATPNSTPVSSTTAISPCSYRCNMCDFTTMRQNVLIMHRKIHSGSGGITGSQSARTAPLRLSNSSFSGESSSTVALKSLIDASRTPSSTKKDVVKSSSTPEVAADNIISENLEAISSASPRRSRQATKNTREAGNQNDQTQPNKISSKRSSRASRATPQLLASSAKSTSEDSCSANVSSSHTEIINNVPVADGTSPSPSEEQKSCILPTDAKHSEQIRQSLLADWSDEEKEEAQHIAPNKPVSSPSASSAPELTTLTTKSNIAMSTTLQLPKAPTKRHSPTIVPLKTLEGSGQTLIVAAATQSALNSQSKADGTMKTTPRIRNIPKKDRLREFETKHDESQSNNVAQVAEVLMPTQSVSASESTSPQPSAKSLEPLAGNQAEVVAITSAADVETANTIGAGGTLSCFDFQEDEDEQENDVLKSIANFKKKYYSPEKDKTHANSNANEQTQPSKLDAPSMTNTSEIEQRDKDLSAEIDSLLEQTAVASTMKDDINAVKGLPIKERGKRIFKSRNRSRVEEDDGISPSEAGNTTASNIIKGINTDLASDKLDEQQDKIQVGDTPEIAKVEKRTRSASKRSQQRGKEIQDERIKINSPANGIERIETDDVPAVSTEHHVEASRSSPRITIGAANMEAALPLRRGKRKSYTHRIMRQLEEEEASIPLIRHSPVEIYNCESPLDNGGRVVRESVIAAAGRRSKASTPSSVVNAATTEDTFNGNGSRASSRAGLAAVAAPLTPTDDTSSLGVSEAGAEFGSPASLLDEERLLTPTSEVAKKMLNDVLAPSGVAAATTEPQGDGFQCYHTTGAENDDDDDEIESPPHEALSGNELEEKSDYKRKSRVAKLPKKKAKATETAKEHAQQDFSKGIGSPKKKTPLSAVESEQKLSDAVAPPTMLHENDHDKPKRLTRANMQLQRDSKQANVAQITSPSPPVETVSLSEELDGPTEVHESSKIGKKSRENKETRKTPSRMSNRLAASSKNLVTDEANTEATLTVEQTAELLESEIESEAQKISNNKSSKKVAQRQKSAMKIKSAAEVAEVAEKQEETEEVIADVVASRLSETESDMKDLANSESLLATGKVTATVVESSMASAELLSTNIDNRLNKPSDEVTGHLTRKRRAETNRSSKRRKSHSKETEQVNIAKSPIMETLDTPTDRLNIDETPLGKQQSEEAPTIEMVTESTEASKIKVGERVAARKSKSNSKDISKKSRFEDDSAVSETEMTSIKCVSPSKNIICGGSTLPSKAVTTTTSSPPIEKVRINVDVANPLSTQIANILAGSVSSSSQVQVQLQGASSIPASTTTSTTKTTPLKISREEIGDVGDDAVVAHVQSLCPQVKITRKERILEPQVAAELTTRPVIDSSNSTNNHTKPQSTQNDAANDLYDISQMPIVLSNQQISTPKDSPTLVSNLWQTELIQSPTVATAKTTSSPAAKNDAQSALQKKIGFDPRGQKYVLLASSNSPPESPASLGELHNKTPSPTHAAGRNNRKNSASMSCSSKPTMPATSPLSPQKLPAAASTGGRKQAGNTITLPSSIAVKSHQHKFAEALAMADSVLTANPKPTKRRSSNAIPTTSASANGANLNRRLSSAAAVDDRSIPTPPKMPKVSTSEERPKQDCGAVSSSPSKNLLQCNRQLQKQNKSESQYETIVEQIVEAPADAPVSVSAVNVPKVSPVEETQAVGETELNSTAKITAVPIQPIPGYPETFLLCMLVDNMYKPINNVPHYLNTDLNQLVPVPPEAYEGMLPELVVEQPPASSEASDARTSSTTTMAATAADQQQSQSAGAVGFQQQPARGTRASETGAGATKSSDGIMDRAGTIVVSDDTSTDETGFNIVLPTDAQAMTAAGDVATIETDGEEIASDNAIVLNFQNQQIILEAATFEQLLANPDANTQLVTDDGTEFVLTREVLNALRAQHDEQNVELLSISEEQQQQQQQLFTSGGIVEAGSSADLLSVALANSEFYGNLQIETTMGGVGTAAGAASGLQLLASDGSIVFQAPPLPQAHLTPPITAHTSETNAVLDKTPIMSTLEKPSTALITAKGGIESPSSVAIESDLTVRPNLDDSLAVIGVTAQSSTVPTSLELPITITNPAIAPKVTMAAAHAADLMQFQPHRSVATAATAAVAGANVSLMFDDSIDRIN